MPTKTHAPTAIAQSEETLGDRLGKYIDEKKISQAELSRMSGVKQQTISHLINNGGKGSSYGIRLAAALGVNPAWLLDGQGNPHDPTAHVGHEAGMTVIRTHWVPLLKMNEEVGSFLRTGETSADTKKVSVTFNVGPRAFSMEVAGRSNEPEMRSGDEVIVDPAVQPEPGDFVVARVGQVVALRKFRPLAMTPDGQRPFELIAVNSDFPPSVSLVEDCEVLGTVVEHRRRLRTG